MTILNKNHNFRTQSLFLSELKTKYKSESKHQIYANQAITNTYIANDHKPNYKSIAIIDDRGRGWVGGDVSDEIAPCI